MTAHLERPEVAQYVNANETAKPNYLRERFAEIAREQKNAAERAKQTQPVPITRKKA